MKHYAFGCDEPSNAFQRISMNFNLFVGVAFWGCGLLGPALDFVSVLGDSLGHRKMCDGNSGNECKMRGGTASGASEVAVAVPANNS